MNMKSYLLAEVCDLNLTKAYFSVTLTTLPPVLEASFCSFDLIPFLSNFSEKPVTISSASPSKDWNESTVQVRLLNKQLEIESSNFWEELLNKNTSGCPSSLLVNTSGLEARDQWFKSQQKCE